MVDENETILIIDDEENVLSSLKRLFRPDGYSMFTALSAEEGLRILEVNPVWLVISDNAMPGTTGLELLKQVRDRWPDTVRIMLTGYADLDSAMAAINRGEVYRFVTKPWDPDGLRLLVRQGLEQYRLIHDNRQMHALIEEQNVLLKQWNESLQKTVEERTEEIRQKNSELEQLYGQLKGSFVNTIKILTGLIEFRNPAIGSHARRVADLAKSIASAMGLAEDSVNNVEVAALLHDIGKIGLPDTILLTDEKLLTTGQRAMLRHHPVLGQAALQIIDSLEPIGVLVKHHHERWNGGGYPDGLKGEAIPPGSRIIAVADSLDHYSKNESRTAQEFIEAQKKPGYSGALDPSAIKALERVVENSSVLGSPHEVSINLRDATAGMVLAQDLRSSTGILLIPKGESIKQSYIDKLLLYERQKLVPSTVYVYTR
ncbi:MAG: response regulator [Chloroflexi bacterium]|nr:response regulator [Chloroflexota bacterium]